MKKDLRLKLSSKNNTKLKMFVQMVKTKTYPKELVAVFKVCIVLIYLGDGSFDTVIIKETCIVKFCC